MSWLNYHHLKYFKTIATEGSISKASEVLSVGQPALSAQLKQLEISINHQLFERRNRKLFLTDAGKVTLKYANEIFGLGSELQEVLKQKSFTTRPHIKIGAINSAPKHLVTELIKETLRTKDCHFTIIEGAGDELYRELTAHTIDLILSDVPLMLSSEKTIYSHSIGKRPVNIYGSEKFKHLKKNFPKSLEEQPIVLPTVHSRLRHDLEHFFDRNNINYNLIAETQDTSIQKILAEDSKGVIAEPEFAVKEMLKDKKLIKIGNLKGVHQEFFLISTQKFIKNNLVLQVKKSFKLR